jgi:cytidyltransferase-like protein
MRQHGNLSHAVVGVQEQLSFCYTLLHQENRLAAISPKAEELGMDLSIPRGTVPMSSRPKVLVSGCYDLLHAGHITFFETASQYGDVYVCVGADDNIRRLKNHAPKFTQEERVYMVGACRYVTHARVSSGSGMLDFELDMVEIRPDYFVVNEDGVTDGKRALCEKHGVELVVLPRTPKPGLPARSSTAVKASLAEPRRRAELPYRICMAGGWMDQPFVSKYHPGSVVVVNIHPTREFNLRSGMATSTRNLWQRLQALRSLPGRSGRVGSASVRLREPAGNGVRFRIARPSWLDDARCEPSRLRRPVLAREVSIRRWTTISATGLRIDRAGRTLCPAAGIRSADQAEHHEEGVGRLGAAGDLCWEAILQKDIRKLGKA